MQKKEEIDQRKKKKEKQKPEDQMGVLCQIKDYTLSVFYLKPIMYFISGDLKLWSNILTRNAALQMVKICKKNFTGSQLEISL